MRNHLFSQKFVDMIHSFGVIRVFSAGTIILKTGSFVKVIPIVLKGSIKVTKADHDNKEILLYYVRQNESCVMSVMAGLNNTRSKICAEIEEDAEILLIPVQNANEWVREFQEWTNFCFSLFEKKFEELLSTVNSLAFEQLDKRLLNLLKQKSDLYGSNEITVAHKQLADELATTREVVSRVLRTMEHAGLISLSRKKISIL